MPRVWLRHAVVDVQQREILLPARAHGSASDARPQDRLSGPVAGAGRVRSTDMTLLAAKVWTYWISWFIVIPVILLVIGVGILYLVKVVSLKHPKN